MDEAAKSAEISNILLNVSEFENIDEATESLVAMSSAYDNLDKTDIVDRLNEVGNNYAISTDGLAQALQRSASALKTAGNDLDESIALVTAGNQVVQDPESVGAGIRTIALRITGTEAAKDELESIGEDTSDFVVQTSAKSQQAIKDFTKVASNNFQGFDILDDNGNFKSTYEILLGISEIYKEIQETDKKYGSNMANGLLETLAGKNRSNIAASILQNPDILKSAYASSQNSQGSAQQELDDYLDSIEGRIQLFTNQVQEFWFNLISSDTVKSIVDGATAIMSALTDIVDVLGEVGSSAVVISTVLGGRKILDYLSGKEELNIADAFFKNRDAESFIVDIFEYFQTWSTAITTVVDSCGDLIDVADAAGDALGIMSVAQVDMATSAASMTQSISVSGLSIGAFAKNLWSSLSVFAKGTLILAGVGAAIGIVTAICDACTVSYEELIEKYEQASDTIQSISDGFKNTEKKVSEISERFSELAQGVDMINGKNISLSDEEYEEFLNLSNELATLFPTLSRIYNENGDAIIQLSGDTDIMTASLQHLLEAERQLANQKIIDSMSDLYAGIYAKSNKTNEEITIATNRKTAYESALEYIQRTKKDTLDDLLSGKSVSVSTNDIIQRNKIMEIYSSVLAEVGLSSDVRQDGSKRNNETGEVSFGATIKLSNAGYISIQDQEAYKKRIESALSDELSNIHIEISDFGKNIEIKQNENKENWNALLYPLSVWLSEDASYKFMNDGMQTIIQSMISSIDFGNLDYKNLENLQEYLKTNIIDKFAILTESEKNTIADAWNELSQLDSSRMSASEYVEAVDKYWNEIANNLQLDDKQKLEMMKNTGFDNEILVEQVESMRSELNKSLPNLSETFKNSLTIPELQLATKVDDKAAEQYQDEVNRIVESEKAKIESEMRSLQDGGSVDLFLRPTIDTSELEKAGFGAQESGYATVNTHTFSSQDGKVAMNFTPIMTDEHGKYLGVMNKDEFTKYCEDVISQVTDGVSISEADSKNLVIGVAFEGEDAIDRAEDAAVRIHELQEDWYDKNFVNRANIVAQASEKVLKHQMDVYKYLGANAVTNIMDLYKSIPMYKAASDIQNPFDLTVNKNEIMYPTVGSTQGINADPFDIKIIDTSFEKEVNDYITKTNSLKMALGKINNESFSYGDFQELTDIFPELADETQYLDQAIVDVMHDMNTDIVSKFSEQFGDIDTSEDTKSLEDFMIAVLKLGSTVGNTRFSINIATETSSYESLITAMQESVSATGLTEDSMANLESRYASFIEEGYELNDLFEETTNGIHLNRAALNKLEKEYDDQVISDFDLELKQLTDTYDILTAAMENVHNQTNLSALYAERETIIQRINDVGKLKSQYAGLASAYNKWQMLQGAGNERDMYEGIISGRKEVEDEMSRGWFDDSTVAFLELLSGKELAITSFDEQIAAYKQLGETIGDTNYSVLDFFTTNSDGESTTDGIYNFFDTVQDVVGETVAWIDENGKYHFDFSNIEGGDKAIADMLGISEELVQILLRASDEAGFTVHLSTDEAELADLKDKIGSINDDLKAIGATDYTFNVNSTDTDNLNEQLAEAQNVLTRMTSGDWPIHCSTEDIENAQLLISAIVRQIQAQRYAENGIPIVAQIDIDRENANSNIERGVVSMQDYLNSTDDLEVAVKARDDTSEALASIKTSIEGLENLEPGISATLDLKDDIKFQTALTNVKADIEAGVIPKEEDLKIIRTKIEGITPEMLVNAGLQQDCVDALVTDVETQANADATVTWTNDEKSVSKLINEVRNKAKVDGTVYWDDNTEKLKTTYTGKGIVYWEGKVDGTTSFNTGTALSSFNAYAKGTNFALSRNEDALINELGTESIVRDGHWFPIPGGAHVEKLQRGDIIFNHLQTKQLMRNGKVTAGGGHGRRAYVNGTFSGMPAYGSTSEDGGGRTYISDISGWGSWNGSSNSGNNSGSNAAEELKDALDWIERKLKDIERDITNLSKTASATYQSWAKRNSALIEELSKVNEQLIVQGKSYERYMQEADSVGLSDYYKRLVQKGAIDLEQINDEGLSEKIQKYQDYYDKAIAAKDAIQDLEDNLAELARQKFDNVIQEYNDKLSTIEHEVNVLESLIDQTETRGYIVSTQYYTELIKQQKENKAILAKEYNDLQTALANAMLDGNIAVYSEEWYAMQSEINGVQEAIIESDTALIEFSNDLRQLEWDAFDRLQDKISNVHSEAEFLISLMEDSKLYDDNGQLTDTGTATMGLHGQTYNAYMHQADQYAKEIADIEEDLAKDPANQELIERKEELLELQRESILNANAEKNAISDMVEEGINKELEALQKKIDLYNEALDAEKDLYDYQRNIEDQTENIAKLQKQLSAYKGDTSEENQSTIQQLEQELEKAQENLEQTEYEHMISEQKKMLDQLYEDYEDILNQRLDDLDVLISDMIDDINANSAMISETLSTEAKNVGYEISDTIQSIWNNDGSATSIITKYGDNFTSQFTSLNNALNAINENIKEIIANSDADANNQIKDQVGDAQITKPAEKPKDESSNHTSKGDGPQDKTITVGGKINAGNAQIYEYAGDTTGSKQYFASDPIYTVLEEKNGYLKVRHHKSSSGVSGWFKKTDVKAYKTGGLIDYDGLAVVHGGQNPELVLNSKDTENFIDLTNTLRKLTKDDLNILNADLFSGVDTLLSHIEPAMNASHIPPMIPLNTSENISNEFNINFELHDVTNGEQVINYLIKSDRFENAVKAMTVDRIAGGSKFSKNKYYKNM